MALHPKGTTDASRMRSSLAVDARRRRRGTVDDHFQTDTPPGALLAVAGRVAEVPDPVRGARRPRAASRLAAPAADPDVWSFRSRSWSTRWSSRSRPPADVAGLRRVGRDGLAWRRAVVADHRVGRGRGDRARAPALGRRTVARLVSTAAPLDDGRVLTSLRRLEAAEVERPIRASLADTPLEPGVFGIWRPVSGVARPHQRTARR